MSATVGDLARPTVELSSPGASVGAVQLVVPAGTHDPSRPTGGNLYDAHLADGLAHLGWRVVTREVGDGWPQPDPQAMTTLASALAEVRNGHITIVDGLVAVGAADLLVREARRIRVVVLVHMPHVAGLSAAARAAEEKVLGAAAAVVTTSDWSRRQLLSTYSLEPHKLHVGVPGTTPSSCSRSSASGGRLLCLGTVSAGKGQDVLLAATEQLADVPGWGLHIVGRLDMEPAFVAEQREWISRSPLRERIVLGGPRWGSALERLWSGADLLVLPSRVESFGMVVLEALARGLPVLASDTGGVPESLGRLSSGARPGLLVPPGDGAALAAALGHWLTDANLRTELQQRAAQRRAALPAWQDTAAAVAAVLAEVQA